jgi:membrane-associated phospholipid phosphatase
VTAFSTWQRPSVEAIERVLLTAIVCAFLTLLIIVDMAGPTALDRWLAGQIQGIQWGGLDFLPALGSEVGGGATGFFLVPLLVAGGLAVRRQWRLVALIGGVYALHYLMISPKLFIPAERPSPLFGVEGAGGLESFPSGHVQWAVSFYRLLAFLAWQAAPRHWRWAIVPAYVTIVVFAALGRIELGRHWPVDTIAGILVGLLAVRILIGIYHHWAGRAGGPAVSSVETLPLPPSSSPAP